MQSGSILTKRLDYVNNLDWLPRGAIRYALNIISTCYNLTRV